MTMAAVVPAMYAVSSLATLASSVASAFSGSPDATAASGGARANQMERVLQRQEAMQLKAMEMQAEASIRKMMTDTANSITSGHLDSAAKVQNASVKAAQGIHF